MKSRIEYIDMAKGLAILLVIVGHIDTIGVLKQAIYSFHMPLFFILSGFFMNPQSISIKKMFRTLIVPYYVVGGVILVLQILVKNADFLHEIKKLFLVMWKYNGVTTSIGPIWFLTTLFIGKLWLSITYRTKYMYTFVIIGALISLLYTMFAKNVLPFTIQQALTCAPFLLIGIKLREFKVFEQDINKQLLVLVGISCAVFSPLMAVAMRVNSLTTFSYFSASIISCLLIYALIELKKSIKMPLNFLSWCGRYSLVILALHSIDDELRLLTLPHDLWPAEVILRCTFTVVLTWLIIKVKPIRELFCV